jgi:hypothetical protein
VHNTTKRQLEKIKGFSETKVEKVKEAVKKCMVSPLSANISKTRTTDASIACWKWLHDST